MEMLPVSLHCKAVFTGLKEPGVLWRFFFRFFLLSLYLFDLDLSMCKAVPVGEACQVPGDCTSNKCEDDGSGNNTNVCKGTYLSISLTTENEVFVRSLQSISPAVVLDVTLLRTHRVHMRA